MSEGFKYQASPKDEDILVNVRGETAEEFAFNLENFPHASYAQFKANFRGGAALGQIVQPQAPQQASSTQPMPSPYNGQNPQAPAPTWATGNQQAAPQQQRPAGNHPTAQLHPEGTQCELPGCSNVLEFKKTQTGKAKWQCPEWRWNGGNPNGHGMEWAN